MKFNEDPRIKTTWRGLRLAWIYFAIYVAAVMGLSYLLGTKPYLWGLPRWVTIGNIVIPVVFVLLLIFVVEKIIPDIPLTDEKQEPEKKA
jgi:uncharacterized membrane protein YhdT